MIHQLLKNNAVITELNAIQEICAPLKNLGIMGIFFVRQLPNHKFIDLSSVGDWTEQFLNKYLNEKYEAESIQEHLFFAPSVSLWALNPQNPIWREGAESFGYGNGVTLRFDENEYTDIIGIYSSIHNNKINDFYVNNLDILTKIYDYFLEKAQPILKKAEKNPLSIPKKYHASNTLKNTKVTTANIKNSIVNFSNAVLLSERSDLLIKKLTERELQCAKLCMQGKSAKEIAKILQISYRTVEIHIGNAKLKLNCRNLKEMITTIIRLNV